MAGINGWEFILLALIAVFVLGPDRLPEYAAKLARAIRRLRVMAEGAKDQLRDQLGPEYEDIDWRQYDPRQYDPRRIVREALLEPLDDAVSPVRDEITSVRDAARRGNAPTNGATANGATAPGGTAVATGTAATGVAAATATRTEDAEVDLPRAWSGPQVFDPERPVPYDVEAT